MEATIRLGRIRGIPIGLHWSWFLIFLLLTWSLAAGYFPAEYPALRGLTPGVLGLVTSILFFVSVLLHELGHSVIAQRNGVPVRSITLFIFGGVAQISQEPPSAGVEFRIAIAGPLVSLGLAAGFGALWWLDRGLPVLAAPSMWLARINLMLALFNMIPGFPLDGGRVLRAAIWGLTGDPRRATRLATLSGQLVAFGFMALGIWAVLGGNVLNGFWLAFIGWFLQNAAAASYAQSNLEAALRGVRVGQVMEDHVTSLPAELPLDRLVAEHVAVGGERSFVVAAEGHPIGLITLTDVARIPRHDWPATPAGTVMVAWDRVKVVEADAPLLTALRQMDDAGVNQLPVIAGNRLVGMLSRERVLHYLRAQAELGALAG